MKSKIGITFALLYVIASVALIWTQGLFGESFVVLLLGMPWSIFFAFFEYWNATGPFLLTLVVVPLLLNVALLYWIGSLFDTWRKG